MTKSTISVVGRRKGLSIQKGPASGWKAVADFLEMKGALPKAYVYRLRAIRSDGRPLNLMRLGRKDPNGLLYIGHTGPEKNKQRLPQLARELTDRSIGGRGHGAGKRYWAHGVDLALRRLCSGFSLQVGWDEVRDFDGPAVSDSRGGSPFPNGSMIRSSSKELARYEERRLLDEYTRAYAELPPLNHEVGERMRDKDQLTGRDVAEDVTPTSRRRSTPNHGRKKRAAK